MYYVGGLVDCNAATPLPAQPIAAVLNTHQLVCEATLGKVEVEAVHSDKLSEEDVLDLLLTLKSIAEDKATPLACVCMQVDIEQQLAVFMLLQDGLLGRIDSRLIMVGGFQVVSIEILRFRIKTVIASVNAIWVEYGHHLKYETFSKYCRLLVFVVCQEIEDAVEHE